MYSFRTIKYSLLGFFSWAVLSFSCTNVEKLDTSAIKENMGAYKIQKVTEAEIQSSLSRLGNGVAKVVYMADCKAREEAIDSLEANFELELNAVKPNSFKSAFEKESQILKALAYELNQGKSFDPTPQKLTEEVYGYYFSFKEHDECLSEKEEPLIWRMQVSKTKLIQALSK